MAVARLRRVRQDKALTQEELAARAGVSQAMVSEYERGAIPTLETAAKICRALDVPLEHIWPELAELLKGIRPTEVAG